MFNRDLFGLSLAATFSSNKSCNPIKNSKLQLKLLTILIGFICIPVQATCTSVQGSPGTNNSGGSVNVTAAGNCTITDYYFSTNALGPVINNQTANTTVTFTNPNVIANSGGTINYATGAITGANGLADQHTVYAKGGGAQLVFNGNLAVDNTYNPGTYTNYGDAIEANAGGQVFVNGNLTANSSAPSNVSPKDMGNLLAFDAANASRSTISVGGNYTGINTGDGASGIIAQTGGLIDITGTVSIKVIGTSNVHDEYGILADGYTGNDSTAPGGTWYSQVNFAGGVIDIIDTAVGPSSTSNSAIRAIQQGNINANGDFTASTNGWYDRGIYVSGNPGVAPSTVTLGSVGNPITATINTTGLGGNALDIGKTDAGTGQGTGILDVASGSSLTAATTGIYASPIKIEYDSSTVNASTANNVNISSAYSALMYGRGPDGIGTIGLSSNLNVSLNNAAISTTFTAADQNTNSSWMTWQAAAQAALRVTDAAATVTGDTCQGVITGSSVYSVPPPTYRSCALISVRGSDSSTLNLTSNAGSTVVTASADSALIDVGDGDAVASTFTLNADGQNTTIKGASEVHDASKLTTNLTSGATWKLASCTNCSSSSGTPPLTATPLESSFTDLNITRSTLDASANSFSLVGNVNNNAAGVIDVAGTDNDTSRTLTITGTYTGAIGSILKLNTVLNSDSNAYQHLVVLGATAGNTILNIKNVGGVGAATTGDGILVVSVTGNSAATFSLANSPLIAGSYQYTLKKGVANPKNWYLVSVNAPLPPATTSPIPSLTTLTTLLLIGVLSTLALLGLRRNRY